MGVVCMFACVRVRMRVHEYSANKNRYATFKIFFVDYSSISNFVVLIVIFKKRSTKKDLSHSMLENIIKKNSNISSLLKIAACIYYVSNVLLLYRFKQILQKIQKIQKMSKKQKMPKKQQLFTIYNFSKQNMGNY